MKKSTKKNSSAKYYKMVELRAMSKDELIKLMVGRKYGNVKEANKMGRGELLARIMRFQLDRGLHLKRKSK